MRFPDDIIPTNLEVDYDELLIEYNALRDDYGALERQVTSLQESYNNAMHNCRVLFDMWVKASEALLEKQKAPKSGLERRGTFNET